MIFVSGKSNVTFHYTYFAIAANMPMIITGTLVHNIQHSTMWIPWLVGLMKTSKFNYYLWKYINYSLWLFFTLKQYTFVYKKIPKFTVFMHKVSNS